MLRVSHGAARRPSPLVHFQRIDGLRQENDKLRVTSVCPGVVTSELADIITDPVAAEAMKVYRSIALEPQAIAAAIAYAIAQPADVDVSEIVVRPTAATGG